MVRLYYYNRIILVTSDHKIDKSKLINLVFTPICDGLLLGNFNGDDMILSELSEDGKYNHFGTCEMRFNSMPIHQPIGDNRGRRTGYLLYEIDSNWTDEVNSHVKKLNIAPRKVYRWEDTSDFSTSNIPNIYH